MEVASVRLTDEEKKFLEELVAKGKFSSISEALKAGLYELMREEKLQEIPWKTRAEVREFLSKKETKMKGLEDLHVEED